MDTNDQIKLPKFRWERVLVLTLIWLGIFMLIALITRSRTMMIAAQILDVIVVLALIGFTGYAFLKAYAKKKN